MLKDRLKSLGLSPKRKGGSMKERRIKVPKKVGKCRYCNDPIYDFQEIKVINGKKYHEGCYKIMKREQPTSE